MNLLNILRWLLSSVLLSEAKLELFKIFAIPKKGAAQKVGFPMELTLGLFFGVIIDSILQLGEGNELLGWSCRFKQ